MESNRDIYASALLLIKQHGEKAEEVASERMYSFMEKDDVKGASVWLQILNAMDTLKQKNKQRYIH